MRFTEFLRTTVLLSAGAATALAAVTLAALANDGDALIISDLDAPAIGDLASKNAIALHELTPQRASLEEAFFELTDDELEFRTAGTAEPSPS